MRRSLRLLLVTVLALSGALIGSGAARAAVSESSGTNVQSGDNRATANQNGGDKSGDSVGGQVSGVVSSGRTSVDARNTSSNSDVSSGDATGSNSGHNFTGLNRARDLVSVADITGVENPDNLLDGNNRTTYSQTTNATTGDGVAGQVIGAVTAAGGSSSIVAANKSDNVDVQTGDARGSNDFAAFTGLNDLHGRSNTLNISDITDSCDELSCFNVQSGNNRATSNQTATAHTGDGVAGQVIGAVSAGATSIDANNSSTNVSVDTGNATSHNDADAFVGLNTNFDSNASGGVTINDISGIPDASNIQDGGNTATFNQTASSTSGDGVGGEVIGAVTSAGGSASIVAANTSNNTDITTGEANSVNSDGAFVGLNRSSFVDLAADVTNSCGAACSNVQSGNNRFTGTQTASSHTGDGVGGQVLGVVSAGATSLDATNKTDDSSVETGSADASNTAATFVGLNDTEVDGTTIGADVSGIGLARNIQDGSNRKTESQSADATSGDAIAGQVSGVVTSAGGSASVVVANSSTAIDSTTGESHFDNADSGFVGLNNGSGPLNVF